jgi:hypothetical protein
MMMALSTVLATIHTQLTMACMPRGGNPGT